MLEADSAEQAIAMLKAGEDQAHDDTGRQTQAHIDPPLARAVCGPHAARRAAQTISRLHRAVQSHPQVSGAEPASAGSTRSSMMATASKPI